MKKAVIYWSGTGNTAAMASAIAAGMGEGTELYSVDQFTGDIAEYDKIAFGCPAMGDEVLEEGEFDPFFSSLEGKLGGKKVRGSTLDKIPGVGDKRRTDLLKHFGSIENIKQASEQELARILPRNAAQSVYEFFHNE